MVLGDVTVLSADLIASRLSNLGRTPSGHAYLNITLSNLGLSDISALQVQASAADLSLLVLYAPRESSLCSLHCLPLL